MNKKQVLRSVFALSVAATLWTGCTSDEVLLNPTDATGKDEGATVTFSLGLPMGDEVNYTKGRDVTPLHDESEWSIKKLKVYDFKKEGDAEPTFVKAYNVEIKTDGASLNSGMCVPGATGGKYQVKLSLSAKIGENHVFAFVANDTVPTFDQKIEDGASLTLNDLRVSVANKSMSTGGNTSTFFGNIGGLAMTGVTEAITIAIPTGDTQANAVNMKRIMARIDVKNYISESRNFKLLSVKLKNSAPNGYLFAEKSNGDKTGEIWNYTNPVTLEQNPSYTANGYKAAGTADYLDAKWVESITTDKGVTGTWYKKVLYAYEYLSQRGVGNDTPTPTLIVEYTLNGWSATTEVEMRDDLNTRFDILRNHVYILQVGDTEAGGQDITFKFIPAEWDFHEINSDLI